MKIICVKAIWCSSCLIMKSRFNKCIKNRDIDLIEYDYDFDSEKIEKLNIGDILPVYIRMDNQKRLIGEKSEQEIINFLEV